MTNPTIPHGTKEQDMSEELKLCPFCGSEVVLDRWTDADTDGTDIAMGEAVCTKCGCCGPAVPLEQAIAAWNQRAKPVVKALEFFKWKRAGGGYHEGQFAANTQAGNYAIMHQASKGAYYLVCPDSTGYYDTLDEAKAAAQADFTCRVHACLEGYDD